MRYFYITMMTVLAMTLTACQQSAIEVTSPKVEMQENPVGLTTTTPRFSWQIDSKMQDILQTSYRIQVARSEKDAEKRNQPDMGYRGRSQ